MEKKIACGARFIIAQIGFDARKSHEMLSYLGSRSLGHVPLVGNVFLLSAAVAQFFRKRTIPGVVISDRLFDEVQRQAQSVDRGAVYFQQLAAKQLAIFRGLGFAGGYLGGVHSMEDVQAILDVESTFAADDWREFAREVQYPVEGEFYYYALDRETRLADASRREGVYEASLRDRRATRNVTLAYRFSRLVHDLVFTPGRWLHRLLRSIYARAARPAQGPVVLRIVEHASKAVMFGCKDCGDCSLPDIAFLCPESQCAKNQRNGPCGGTRDGVCEVEDFECIWSRAYDRLKFEGRELHLLDHAPVIQDESLRGTSSWANAVLCRDHSARFHPAILPAAPPGACASSNETAGESEISFDGNYPAHPTQAGVISSQSAPV
jgi:methylenetetrahydrofolate reductase (NADPH)